MHFPDKIAREEMPTHIKEWILVGYVVEASFRTGKGYTHHAQLSKGEALVPEHNDLTVTDISEGSYASRCLVAYGRETGEVDWTKFYTHKGGYLFDK